MQSISGLEGILGLVSAKGKEREDLSVCPGLTDGNAKVGFLWPPPIYLFIVRNLMSKGTSIHMQPMHFLPGENMAFGVPQTWAGSRPATHWLCKLGPVTHREDRDACLAGLSRDSVS